MSSNRNRLEQNELAERLGSGLSTIQPALPIIIGGLALLAIGSIVWGIYSASTEKQAATAWTEFYFQLDGGDEESFQIVAEDFDGSTASGWASQTVGDTYLEKGIDAMFRNRAEGEKLINQAIDAYEQANETAASDELRAKSTLGLAKANESLGNLAEAAGYYEEFVKSSSSPRLLAAASERLAFINSEQGKEFYKWFDQLDPKPDSSIQLPSDLSLPPSSPGDLNFGPLTGGTDADTPMTPPTGELPAGGEVPLDPSLPPIPEGELPKGVEEPASSNLPEIELPPAGEPTTQPDGSPVGEIPAGSGQPETSGGDQASSTEAATGPESAEDQ